MPQSRTLYVGMDVHKDSIAVAYVSQEHYLVRLHRSVAKALENRDDDFFPYRILLKVWVIKKPKIEPAEYVVPFFRPHGLSPRQFRHNAGPQPLPKAGLGRDKARCLSVRFLIPPV